jgi:hypothetical protein
MGTLAEGEVSHYVSDGRNDPNTQREIMSLRLVVMNDALVEPVCTAFERVFGEARSPEGWRQIYRDSPDGSVGVVCLNEKNAVMGHYGATLHRVAGMGRDGVVFGQLRDVFTHPAVRAVGTGRSSLFARLGQEFHGRFGGRDIDVLYGFGSERHFRLGARLLGYRPLVGLTMWGRDVPPLGNVTCARLGALVPVARFNEDVDALWAQRPAISVMAVPRTAVFLNWRFAPRPNRIYRCFRYDSFLAGGMAGYAVVAQDAHRAGEEAGLVDFRLPDDPGLRSDMWHQLMDRLARFGVRRLALMASTAVPETSCLPSLGCAPLTAPLPSVPAYLPYRSEWGDPEFGTICHLTMADGDIF